MRVPVHTDVWRYLPEAAATAEVEVQVSVWGWYDPPVLR